MTRIANPAILTTIVAVLLMLFISMYYGGTIDTVANDCAAKGGVLVRDVNGGFVCVKGRE